MDEHAIEVGVGRRGRQLYMECRSRRFPVVAMGSDGCLIDVPEGFVPAAWSTSSTASATSSSA